MSMNTGSPTATDISLTYDEEGDQWRARDETRGVTVRASTRAAALDALDAAVANDGETDPHIEVDTDDPFFTAPTFSSGQPDVSRNVDEYLAEDTYRDKLGSDEGS
jgi:acid phosphatase class B